MARGPWLHLVNHSLDHDFLSRWQTCCLSIGDTMRITVTANHLLLLLLFIPCISKSLKHAWAIIIIESILSLVVAIQLLPPVLEQADLFSPANMTDIGVTSTKLVFVASI